MAAVARPVGGEGRAETAVGAELKVDERARQAEPRDVLRVDRIDGGEGRQANQGEQQQLPAWTPPGERGRTSACQAGKAWQARAPEARTTAALPSRAAPREAAVVEQDRHEQSAAEHQAVDRAIGGVGEVARDGVGRDPVDAEQAGEREQQPGGAEHGEPGTAQHERAGQGEEHERDDVAPTPEPPDLPPELVRGRADPVEMPAQVGGVEEVGDRVLGDLHVVDLEPDPPGQVDREHGGSGECERPACRRSCDERGRDDRGEREALALVLRQRPRGQEQRRGRQEPRSAGSQPGGEARDAEGDEARRAGCRPSSSGAG